MSPGIVPEFLKELELTEGRGTGLPKIIRTMRENGSPEPVFEFDEYYSYFMVRLPVHEEVLRNDFLKTAQSGASQGPSLNSI